MRTALLQLELVNERTELPLSILLFFLLPHLEFENAWGKGIHTQENRVVLISEFINCKLKLGLILPTLIYIHIYIKSLKVSYWKIEFLLKSRFYYVKFGSWIFLMEGRWIKKDTSYYDIHNGWLKKWWNSFLSDISLSSWTLAVSGSALGVLKDNPRHSKYLKILFEGISVLIWQHSV